MLDRVDFKRVMATGKPYVSAGLMGHGFARAIVVVAVPTFGRYGSLDGILTGAILLNPNSAVAEAATKNEELGFTGLTIIDRDGQLITDGPARTSRTER